MLDDAAYQGNRPAEAGSSTEWLLSTDAGRYLIALTRIRSSPDALNVDALGVESTL